MTTHNALAGSDLPLSRRPAAAARGGAQVHFMERDMRASAEPELLADIAAYEVRRLPRTLTYTYKPQVAVYQAQLNTTKCIPSRQCISACDCVRSLLQEGLAAAAAGGKQGGALALPQAIEAVRASLGFGEGLPECADTPQPHSTVIPAFTSWDPHTRANL